MSTAGSFSPSSVESPLDDGQQMDVSSDAFSSRQVFDIIGDPTADFPQTTLGSTEIKILVQPVDKFRFRYKSEMMGTHGSLLGEREESSHRKEVPTVQLINCPVKDAVIRCTLVTADEDRRYPHPHHLVRKDGDGDKDDPHDIKISDENNYIAMFCNMGIIHTAKKNIKAEILRKRKIEVLEEKRRTNPDNPIITTKEDLEMKMEAEKAQKWMNLNSVALCFQGFCYDESGVLHPLTEKVYSRPINNLKSALTGELKICRIDKHTSTCDGNEEVWLLVEKVGRKNIKVKFYEMDDSDNVVWEAEGRFSELDVHHQYAIVFKTPPYKDTNITEPKEVLLKLVRPSDGEQSNSIKFVYKPSDKVLNRKRPRIETISGSAEFNSVPNYPNQTNQLYNGMHMETMTNLPCDNISNISGELSKLLQEGNCAVDSEDMKDFLKDPQFEQYLGLTDPLIALHDDLQSDGHTEFEKARTEFAKDILQKITQILKDIDAQLITKDEAIDKVMKLLQETTYFGDTPLHFALRNMQFELAKSLLLVLSIDLSLRAVINTPNTSGKTPLHLAVLQNQSEIVRAMLKLGADPNLPDENDERPLHNAVEKSANACIDEILRADNLRLEAHTESGWSALHLAAKAGSLHAVKALINAGADVNSVDMSYGRTALHIAVDSNHKHIVDYLLAETNIDVNLKNFGGNTALHNAIVKGGKCAEELVSILKKYGADPSIRNNHIRREEENEEMNENSNPPSGPSFQSAMDDSATPTIKSENSSENEEEEEQTGESSFDLARDDPKLMKLLSSERPQYQMEEELDLKEESEDEMTLLDRTLMAQMQQNLKLNHQPKPKSIPEKKITTLTPQQQEKLQQLNNQNDELLTDAHVARITAILDRTGGWERLAHHTNHGSLVRLYKKMTSPSRALLVKIRLQNPNITVRQIKKYLIDVQALEAASALEPS